MPPIPSLRLWLAACGACAATTASAQSLPDIPAPKIDYPISSAPQSLPARLAPVERVGGPAPVETLPDASAAPATKGESAETAAACATEGAATHGHDKHYFTKYGNVRTCKIPPTSAIANGAVVRSVFARQKQLAMAEYFVVYREDFASNSADLNATGLRHVHGIYKRLDLIDDPVLVEPTGNAKLDEQRRDAVVKALIQHGAPTGVSGRVSPGTTRAEGLRYEDIPSVGKRNPLGGSGGGFGGGGLGLSGVGGFGGFR